MLAVCYRDRQRSIAKFHEALAELQGSPLLPQAGVAVTAVEETPGSELMAVATAAVTALATVEQHMQQHADSSSWQGRLSYDACIGLVIWHLGAWSCYCLAAYRAEHCSSGLAEMGLWVS